MCRTYRSSGNSKVLIQKSHILLLKYVLCFVIFVYLDHKKKTRAECCLRAVKNQMLEYVH
jgi:hypothetical protein